jgi:hypothetical protein
MIERLEKVSCPPGKDPKRGSYWRCRCTRCGNENYIATSGDLNSGRIKSCGCYRNSQEFADSCIKHGHNRKNKGWRSPTYNTWASMKSRCNGTHAGSKYYTGVKLDPRWEVFENFLADMGEKPLGLELDRIDPFGDYTKANCRWVTHAENMQNMRKHYTEYYQTTDK